MIDVIVNEHSLCRTHCLFDGMQLLRHFQTRAFRFEHFDDGAQMPFRALEALLDVGVRRMNRGALLHSLYTILVGRIRSIEFDPGREGTGCQYIFRFWHANRHERRSSGQYK